MRNKHEIFLLTPSFNNISIKGIKIKLIPMPKITIPFIKTIFGTLYAWTILPYLLIKKKIELVSIFNPSFIGTNVLLISKFLKIPNCINLRGVFEQKSLLKFIEHELGFFFTSNIIINSRDMIQRFNNVIHLSKKYFFSKRFFYIPNGINYKYWKFKSLEFKNTDKKYDLVFVGNMTSPQRWRQKGFIYLNDALKIIAKKYKHHLNVLVIGEINFKGSKKILKRFQKNYFRFIGKISEKIKLIRLLLSAKIFVLPSISEGMPNSLMEAMALGIPCISTKVGAVTDLISDNEEGILINPKNPQQLADKIYFLYNNPALQSKLGNNAQEKIKKNYSWKKTIKKVDKCLERILFN